MGLSDTNSLALRYKVAALGNMPGKVDVLKSLRSPIQDPDVTWWQATRLLNLRATLDKSDAYAAAQMVVLVTPMDHDPVTNHFSTASVGITAQMGRRYGIEN